MLPPLHTYMYTRYTVRYMYSTVLQVAPPGRYTVRCLEIWGLRVCSTSSKQAGPLRQHIICAHAELRVHRELCSSSADAV